MKTNSPWYGVAVYCDGVQLINKHWREKWSLRGKLAFIRWALGMLWEHR